MDILAKSLNLIDDIINNNPVQNLNFYQNLLKMMSSLYGNDYSICIFFCENSNYSLKAGIQKGKIINE